MNVDDICIVHKTKQLKMKVRMVDRVGVYDNGLRAEIIEKGIDA